MSNSSTPQHTPGPWTAVLDEEGWGVQTDEKDPWFITEALDCEDSKHSSRMNAMLIAAAPDLLAVLLAFPGHQSETEWNNWISRKNAAIAKATGKE